MRLALMQVVVSALGHGDQPPWPTDRNISPAVTYWRAAWAMCLADHASWAFARSIPLTSWVTSPAPGTRGIGPLPTNFCHLLPVMSACHGLNPPAWRNRSAAAWHWPATPDAASWRGVP